MVRHFKRLSEPSPFMSGKNLAGVNSSLRNAGIYFSPNPSYANEGGTGNRTGLITTSYSGILDAGAGSSALVNGVIASGSPNADYFRAGQYFFTFFFVFPIPKYISEFKWYQDGASPQGTWNFQALSDSGWVNLSSPFTLGHSIISTYPLNFYDGTPYTNFRLTLTSGSTTSAPWLREIEFKIDGK